ncbi:MAG: hypothetical protein JW966_10210 [Anaerolineae bacterium]|nr:hypothetical protein [Anaerolineae bacterium]
MSAYKKKRTHASMRASRGVWQRSRSTKNRGQTKDKGQALIEYALIIALVAIGLIGILTLTGPAVGNVFSNQVYNLLGGTIEPRDTLQADDFWTQVAAVASYTPEEAVVSTNVPREPTTTPSPGPTRTPTPVTPSPEPTDTPTPGPSPTPQQMAHDFEFYDPANNKDWWMHDMTGSLYKGKWDAEYWSYGHENREDGCTYGSDCDIYWRYVMSNLDSLTPGSGWSTTHDEIAISLGKYDSLYSLWGAQYYDGGTIQISNHWYGRYVTQDNINFEDKTYTLRIKKYQYMRIWVGDTLVVDEWDRYDNNTWMEYNFNPGASEKKITVEVGHGRDASTYIYVQLYDPSDPLTRLEDNPECNWTLSEEDYRSPNKAWNDSPGGNYQPYSSCILALRGYVDLTDLDPATEEAVLEYWEKYSLNSSTRTYVAVSEAGTGAWEIVETHYNDTNLGWSRETFDLTNFGTNNVNFIGKQIQMGFVIENTSSSGRDGWYIDDIEVKRPPVRFPYRIPFTDDMEGDEHWYAGGTWAISGEFYHSENRAWSDSPDEDYVHGSNSTLELDYYIDLIDIKPGKEPEVTFWHRYDLTDDDSIWIEVSDDDRVSWHSLVQDVGGNDTYLAYEGENLSWNQVALSLNDYVGQNIYLRFRLDARYNDKVAQGWWIDDFSLRYKSEDSIEPDWCDNMEAGGSNWIAGGEWAVVNGTDFNADSGNSIQSPTDGPRGGYSQFWSDSPGKNYEHDSNATLALNPELDLTGVDHAEMSFWNMWDVADSEDLYVEVTTDGGENWTTVWNRRYNNKPPGYSSVRDYGGYNRVMSWAREVIDLSDYANELVTLRFRLDATDDTDVLDGWWIDDVCFLKRDNSMLTVPFFDDYEIGGGAPNYQNWYVGGTWVISDENFRSGGSAMTDSQGVNYVDDANTIIELAKPVNLSGTTLPTLYFWDTWSLASKDYGLFEINVANENPATWTADDDLTWQGWNNISAVEHYYSQVLSWNRLQVDLSPYINKFIKIRFRLYAAYGSSVADGWYIDNVSIIDRGAPGYTDQVHPMPFFDNLETINDDWVLEGTWARVPSWRAMTNADLGPGGWTAEYYYVRAGGNTSSSSPIFEADDRFAVETVTEINTNWSWWGPYLPFLEDFKTRYPDYARCEEYARDPSYYRYSPPETRPAPYDEDWYTIYSRCFDYYLVKYSRTIYTEESNTTLQFYTQSDDRIRVIVDGVTVYEYWSDRGFTGTQNPWLTEYTIVNPGPHAVEIHFYERTGDARVLVQVNQRTYVFHDSPSGDYFHGSNMSVMLEGVVDLTGTSNPALSYWQKYDLNSGDSLRTEISTDAGFSWSEIGYASGDQFEWDKRVIPLSSYVGRQVNIRFRLDARSDTRVGDGWWIDDIQIAE